MNRRRFVQTTSLAASVLAARRFLPALAAQSAAPARASRHGSALRLENGLVAAEWDMAAAPRLLRVEDKRGRQSLNGLWPAFALDKMVFLPAGTPRMEDLVPNPAASRRAERLGGKQWTAEFVSGPVRATWRGVLRDGSAYIRQEVTFVASEPAPVQQVVLVDMTLADAKVSGRVKGSPVTAGNWFAGFEHPLSASTVTEGRAVCALSRPLPLPAGQPVTYSSVIGPAPAGQMRRAFLEYVERERAHPYRTFLHYNSWYDLGYFTPYAAADCLDVIHSFGEQLKSKRGVTLDSFLFDDGWDDHKLWGFNEGFPDGFTPVRAAAEAVGAEPGVWMSPWGGYGKPRQERLDYGAQFGFETNRQGFALSGPIYYQRFHEVCLEMVRKYGVNQFKIDGTGSSATVVPDSKFGSDFEAAISLIADLRQAKPDLFINLTTGTYPSPFWLWHADSIWRGGEDHSFAGVGSDRQQWITYRDADTYQHVVQAGPLYPINSLMLHGMIYAQSANKLNVDPEHDFDAEVRAYFGTGTHLQEMYITHSLLEDDDWNVLAEAALWSRTNAGTLVDSHWIGGDPKQLEAYGHAAWAGRSGALTLRNPSDKPQSIEVDVAAALELPPDAPPRWTARTPWKRDQWRQPVSGAATALSAGQPHAFALKPFEVLTLDLTAAV